MRGAGPISVNGTALYGYFTEHAGGVRLRLSLDDWDRLGLCEGQWVTVGFTGGEATAILLVAASRQPPVVWLELRSLSRPARAG